MWAKKAAKKAERADNLVAVDIAAKKAEAKRAENKIAKRAEAANRTAAEKAENKRARKETKATDILAEADKFTETPPPVTQTEFPTCPLTRSLTQLIPEEIKEEMLHNLSDAFLSKQSSEEDK